MENPIFQSHPNAIPIQIRKVWTRNMFVEFNFIESCISRYPYIAIDTEFPGVIHSPDSSNSTPIQFRPPSEQYQFIKKNVDDLHMIQLGLTLMDYNGNLPMSSENNPVCFIWEFNFCDFDPERDLHNSKSIEFLRGQGFDFNLHRRFGIKWLDFRYHVMRTHIFNNPSVTWLSFHSGYDFAYLLKIINRQLPENLNMFLGMVRSVFGNNVYDIKHVLQFCKELHGGLEMVARTLGVHREAGIAHNAGSDSLLIGRVYQKIRDKHFKKIEPTSHVGVLYGLEN